MQSSNLAHLDALRLSIVRLGAIGAALLVVVVLTVTRSEAAFSAATVNGTNALAAGTVVLTDDDAGTAMFTVTNMSPGTPVTECLEVTYSGTQLPAPVRLYGATTGTLDTYVDTVIEEGTGGSFGDCTGFAANSTVFTGTLESFGVTHTNWATGAAVFTAAGTPTVRVVRVTFTLQDNNTAQGLSSTVDFTFETQA